MSLKNKLATFGLAASLLFAGCTYDETYSVNKIPLDNGMLMSYSQKDYGMAKLDVLILEQNDSKVKYVVSSCKDTSENHVDKVIARGNVYFRDFFTEPQQITFDKRVDSLKKVILDYKKVILDYKLTSAREHNISTYNFLDSLSRGDAQ